MEDADKTPKSAAPGGEPVTPFSNLAVAPTPWTLRNLLVLLGCAFLALIAANFLAMAGYMLLVSKPNWKLAPEALRYNAIFNASLLTVFHILFLGVVYLFLVVNHGLPFWKGMGWKRISARAIAACAFGGVGMAILIQFAPPLLPSSQEFPLQKLFNSPAAGYIIAAFAILIAPFMEELIFRGLLFAFLERLTGVPMAVVGTAQVVKRGYPDSTAWDPSSDHPDPKSTPDSPIWYMVDIQAEKPFRRPVTLEEIKANPKLKDMMLARRGMRLSIQPVTPQEWEEIIAMGEHR